MVPNCPWGGYAIIYSNNPVCLGFGWARSFVHCGEKVLNSKAVSRLCHLHCLSLSLHPSKGDTFIATPPNNTGKIKE